MILFNDTKIKSIKNKKLILKKISKVIDRGIFLNGPEVSTLEANLQKFFEKKFFVSCASGHDALFLSLQALGLKKDNEVIFPVNAYPTAFPIFLSRAKGVPADVDNNGQLDPDEVLKLITQKTKAILIVHLYGLVGNFQKIIDICKKNKLFLIEDCAQAFGGRYKNKLVGRFGDISCFSFYPTKNLATLGDGGGILTNNKNCFDFLKKAVKYGEKEKYKSQFISGHSRLPEIQAAVLNLYLKNIDQEISKRQELFDYYRKQITKYNIKEIRVLESDKNSKPSTHLFVIATKRRDQLRNFLAKKNIPTLIHYPLPVNEVDAFKFLKNNQYPNAERLSKEIISLPFHPDMKKNQIDYIVNSIKIFLQNEKA